METFVWDAWWPGGTVLAVLSALFLWVRSRTNDPGFLAFALAFLVGALIYLVKNPLMRDFGGTSVLGLSMAGLAAVLMATGMCLYTHPEQTPVRKAVKLAAGWAVVVVLLHAIDIAGALTAHVSLSVLILFLAGMAWSAARHEPGVGFGILTAAFLVQPMVVALGWINGVPELRVRLWTWVPFGIAGLTLLVVAQMRSRMELAAELVRRQQAEASLQALNESLEETVGERTARLEQVVEGLNAFTGMVSHDLSGPLRNAAGLTEVALDASEREQANETFALLHRIRKEVLRGSSMVSDLMALARADQSPLVCKSVDLARLVQDSVRDLTPQYPHAPTAVRIDALPVVCVDESMMRHVVLNLLGNALKFTTDREAPSVTVSAVPDGEGWRVEIRDNGPGFDPGKAALLFKPFSRLGNSAAPGTGLGLTVVKRAVERHGGAVGADAEPGSGARFWWTLPSARAVEESRHQA